MKESTSKNKKMKGKWKKNLNDDVDGGKASINGTI